MLHRFMLCIFCLVTNILSAQTDNLTGYWENKEGVGANWSQGGDAVWFVSLTEQWKEFFEGKVVAPGIVRGRLKKIHLKTGARTDTLFELRNIRAGVMQALDPMLPDGSFSASAYFTWQSFFSRYNNIQTQHFDEKYRDWGVKTWFQDGDTAVYIEYFNNTGHYQKGWFVGKDSLVAIRYRSLYNNTCLSKEAVTYKLGADSLLLIKFREIDGFCDNKPGYARSGFIRNRYGADREFLNPEGINPDQVPVPLEILRQNPVSFIHRLEVNGQAVLFNPERGRIAPVVIKEGADVSIHFSNPYLHERLYFQLEGYDAGWMPESADHTANYFNLPGGSYIFKITTDPGRPDALEEIKLRVEIPYYRKIGFYLATAAAIAAAVLSRYWLHARRRRREAQLRRHIARDLHDEIGSTLSSISILTEAAKHRADELPETASLTLIGDKAREAMDNIGDIIWSVNPRNDSMVNVLRRMKEFAVEILENQGIALHFEADEAAAALNLPMEQRKDFYLLFKEAVNNAAKYSGARDVWVKVRAENGGLTLEVRDNGRGFDVAQVKRGNGLWNMQRRAERMGGKFELESGVGEGTRVQVRV